MATAIVSPETRSPTVFCDFDGPIVDVSDRYYDTYRQALEQTQNYYTTRGEMLRSQPLNKEQFWEMKCERACDSEIAMRSGLQPTQIECFIAQVRAIVNHPQLLHRDRLHPGANRALAQLHARGTCLILVTLRPQSQARQILCNHGLLRLFCAIYGTIDPEEAYQNRAASKTELLEIAYRRWVGTNNYMLGDTEADILAARALGVEAIALTCGIRSRAYLSRYQPHHLCDDLLSAANYLLQINAATGLSLSSPG